MMAFHSIRDDANIPYLSAPFQEPQNKKVSPARLLRLLFTNNRKNSKGCLIPLNSWGKKHEGKQYQRAKEMAKYHPFSLVFFINTLISLTILPFNALAIALPPSLAVPANVVPHHCTPSPDWLYHYFNIFECSEAMNKFLDAVSSLDPHQPVQFLQRGTSPFFPHDPRIFTPRKFVYNRCTVAVTMLKTIPAGTLPGETPGSTFRTWDISQWEDVVLGAVRILTHCILHPTVAQAGWTAVGQPGAESIGVMFYATGSHIDEVVGDAVNGVGAGNTTLLNETAAVNPETAGLTATTGLLL